MLSTTIIHWTMALLLVAMGTFALLEKRSAAFVSRSLLLWPLAGFLLSAAFILAVWIGKTHPSCHWTLIATGIVLALCSAQALLVNIRKLSRWPSGLVWLGLVLLCFLYQFPSPEIREPAFQTFFIRLLGWGWAAIGLTKVLSERAVAQESGIPAWILLLYVQAALIASSPF